jgi:hypothetical protein
VFVVFDKRIAANQHDDDDDENDDVRLVCPHDLHRRVVSQRGVREDVRCFWG